jgi:hypothetical protein
MPLSQRVFTTLMLIVVSTIAGAQSTIAGVVKDAWGAVLPGVSVEAENTLLNQRVEVVTDSNGAFSIARLPTGTYTFTFILSGFEIPSLKNVEVSQDATVGTRMEGQVRAKDDRSRVDSAHRRQWAGDV